MRALLRCGRSFSSLPAVKDVHTVGVVGLGLMGHGIAQAAATAGMRVIGVEREENALDAGRNRIEASVTRMLAKQVAKGTLSQEGAEAESLRIVGNLSYATRIEAVHECDLVVEAIVEDMRIKVPFWRQLGALCKPEAIFGSNTSSLPITAQAEASGRPEQFVGLHFFNPVQLMKLVEVIATEHTDAAVFETAKAWAARLPDKVVVSCKDTPGARARTAGARCPRHRAPPRRDPRRPAVFLSASARRLHRQPAARARHRAGARDGRPGRRDHRRHRHRDEAGRRPPDGAGAPRGLCAPAAALGATRESWAGGASDRARRFARPTFSHSPSARARRWGSTRRARSSPAG